MASYTFQFLPGMKGETIEIQSLTLQDVALRFIHVAAGILPQLAGYQDPGRRNALRRRPVQPKTEGQTAGGVQVETAIQVIEVAVPDLRGRLFSRLEDLPRTADGGRVPLHWHWQELGDDFLGLLGAVLVASELKGEEADLIRRFLEDQSMVLTLDRLAQRYKKPPSSLMGLDGTPGSLAINLYTAAVGAEADARNQARALAEQGVGRG